MAAQTSLHKITAFTQILRELQIKAHALETKIIKTAGEEDLRHMLLSRYPLKLFEMPETTPALVQELENLLPDVKKIIEKVMDTN